MKNFLLTLLISLCWVGAYAQNSSALEYKLQGIVSNFKAGADCSEMLRATSNLTQDIETELNNSSIKPSEESKLNQLNKETVAVEKFIASVGGCRKDMLNMDDLQLANQRFNASVTHVFSGKHCVNFFKVELGEQIAYLAKNDSSKAITIDYKWTNHNGSSAGSGNMGIIPHHLRNVYDNQDNKEIKSIKFTHVACSDIE